MKILVVIALFFLLPKWIRAQQYLFPFEDYRTCLTGLRSQKGDTIWPAVFDKATVSHGWDGAFWLVSQAEKTGLLDHEGRILYPCAYDKIRYYPVISLLILDSAGRSCIRSSKGELLHPYVYNSIEPVLYDDKTFYEVSLDGKKGLLDSAFNQVIPVIYSNISIGKAYGSLHAKMNYISVSLDSKWGAFRWDGTEICKPVFNSFRSLDVHSTRSSDVITGRFFTFTEQVGSSYIYGIMDAQGKVLYKSADNDYFKVYSISSNTSDEEKFIVTARNKALNTVVAFPVENPTLCSPEMESIAPVHNGYLGIKGDSVYFFDLQTDYCKQFKGSASYLANEISSYDAAYNPEHYEELSAEPLIRDVFLIYTTYKSQHRNKNEYRLYSTIHSKSSKKTYTEIERYTLFGKDYFWCYRVYAHNKQQLDILNDSLEVVAHFNKACFPVADPIIIKSSQEVLLHVNDYFSKSGLVATDGSIIIPVDYYWIQKKDDGIFEASQSRSQLLDYYFQDGRLIKKDVLNLKKINEDVYAIQYKNKYYSLYSKSFELLMDSCTDVIQADGYLPLKHSSIYVQWIVLKNGYFFRLNGEDVHAIDSESFGFGSVKNAFGKFLLGANNEILYQGNVIDYNQFYLVEEADSVHWVKRDGKVLRSLKKTSIHIVDKYIFLNDSENSGVVNTQTAEWVVKPQPLFVIVDKNNHAGIWGKLPQSESWVLLDSTGKQLFEQQFDYPVPIHPGKSTLFQHDQRFGLLNQDVEVILPADYAAIFDLDGAYCFRKDVKWGILSANGNRINPVFDAVTPIEKSDNIIVFQEHRAGILDKKMNWILPLMSFDSIIQYADIARILNMKMVTPKKFSDSSILKEITNRELLIQLSGRNIGDGKPYMRFDMGAFYFSDNYFLPRFNTESNGNYSSAYNSYFKCAQLLLNEKYYSLCLENEYLLAANKHVSGLNFPEGANCGKLEYRSYYNFTIDQDSLIPMVLADLFKENSNEQLNAIIEKEIVQQQIFGINCVNLPKMVSLVQGKFYLQQNGVVFYGAGSNYLFIPYEKLKAILRYPELFL